MKTIRRGLPLLAASLAALAGCTREHEISSRDDLYRVNTSHVRDRPFMVEGEPFSGVVVHREGEHVVFRASMRDGRKHGPVETFYEGGKRQSREEVAWDEDEQAERNTGDAEAWCENGTRRLLTEYGRKGVRRLAKEWDCETGKQVAETEFDADGKQQGVAGRWTADGTLIEQASWQAGNLDGEKKAWTPDGVLVEHSRYRNGQRHGVQETWHANGKPASRGEFADDKPVGRYEAWAEDGRLVEGGSYAADGSKTGPWLEQSGNDSVSLHYGPGGFVPAELLNAYGMAVWARPDAQTVAFYLGEGRIRLGDALPANYGGDPNLQPYRFPVRDWTYAVVVADDAVLPLLLEKGADINQADSDGVTRLLRCVKRYRHDTSARREDCRPAQLQALLDKGASAAAVDHRGRNALHRLLDVHSYDDRGDVLGRQATEARQARVDLVGVLARAGADVNAADAEGWTPLVQALKSRRLDLVKAVLAAGARADGPGPEGSKVVHWLFLDDTRSYSIRGDFVAEALPLLVAAGADPGAKLEWDGQQVGLRELAVRHGLIDLVRVIDQNAKRS